MATFAYAGRTRGGQTVSGERSADSMDAAVTTLRREQIFVTKTVGQELLGEIKTGIDEALTPHQRRVLVALALNDVPIDVLAERLETTRGALYKTLHDARHKLRRHLADAGHSPDGATEEVT